MFAHPTRCLKIPSASSRRVADLGGYEYRARFDYYGLRCTQERIALSALKDKDKKDI